MARVRQRYRRTVRNNRADSKGERHLSSERVNAFKSEGHNTGSTLRNRLGKRRSCDSIVGSCSTIHSVKAIVCGLNGRRENLVIVQVNYRPCGRSSNASKCYVEQQTVIRSSETTKTEDLFVSYTRTIKSNDATNIPGHSQRYTSSIVNTVFVLTGSGEHNGGRGNACWAKLSRIHLDHNVEAVKSWHIRDINPEVDYRTLGHTGMNQRRNEDSWSPNGTSRKNS